MSLSGMVFALVAAFGASPEAKPAEEPPPIEVVLRTSDDVHIGRDLRYKDGEFRLRQGDRDAAVPEAEVLRISLLRPRNVPRLGAVGRPGEEKERVSLIVALAVRVAVAARAPDGPRGAKQRPRLFPDWIFMSPDEPLAETFRWMVPKVRHPELAAVLCAEVVKHCIVARRPADALALLREAEEKVKDEPAQGIVYGLMQAAVLFGQDRTTEGLAIIRRLDKAYPTHRREMGALITLLRRRGDVRMPPRVPREP